MRPVAALRLDNLTPADLTGQSGPDFDLVALMELWIDDAYQRGLSPRGVELSRHVVPLDTASLPEPVLAALASTAIGLRHMPRDAILDRAELVVWLRRMAGRVDGVAALRMARSQPRPKRTPAAVAFLVEAVFSPSGLRGGAASRTVTGRRDRQVAVETRRARERGQIETPW